MKRLGDRHDGRLIRSLDSFYKFVPFIMKTRVDALVYFNDKIIIDNTEAYMKVYKALRKNNISFLHVVIAAIVRTISQKPGLNRFIAGQRIYARNEILISINIKKEMKESSPETVIKMKFSPSDTIFDVIEKVNSAIGENKGADSVNDADKTTNIFMMCPRIVINFFVGVIKLLDYYGFMPELLSRVSPFHTSIYVTDLGSLGIQPVYHHLYNFGTTSVFISFGKKQKERYIERDHSITEKRYVDFKIAVDERIVDGYYYANAFKFFKKLVENPDRLETPPESVIADVD